jgi:hypothetical protein
MQAAQSREGPNLPHQLWAFEKEGAAYVLRVRHTGLALSVRPGSRNEGAPVVQSDKVAGVTDQQWSLRPVIP